MRKEIISIQTGGGMVVPDASTVPGLRRSRWTRLRSSLGGRLARYWKPYLFAGVILGFLMARAIPLSPIAPLGLAFHASVRGAGFSPPGSLAVGLAVIAGSLSVPASNTIWVALAILFTHFAFAILELARREGRPAFAAVIAAAAVGLLSLKVPLGETPIDLLFWTGLTGVLALIFTLGIADVTSGRLFYAGSSDAPIPSIVIMAAAMCGLYGPGNDMLLRDVAASLIVLVGAYTGGPTLGASAAAVLGIGLLFPALSEAAVSARVLSPDQVVQSMALVVAGLLAGTFRDLRRVGVGLAFCLGMTTYSMLFLPNLETILVASRSLIVAIGLFWLLPGGWLTRIPLVLMRPHPHLRERVGREQPDSSVLLNRVRGISRVLREVSRTFEQVAVVQAPPGENVRRVFERASERVCRSCSLYQQCWEKEFSKTYQLYTDLWAQIDEEGPLTTKPVPVNLDQHCIYPDRVAATLNYLYDLHQTHHHWERRLTEGRGVVTEYVRNVGRLLDRMTEEAVETGARGALQGTPIFRITSGVARLPKRGGHVSGDSFVVEPLGSDRYLIAVSDGMGVGGGAALESRQCVKLVHEILRAGFTTDVAVRTVNSALLLRSPEESFATVDLALIDLATGRAEFVKVGAAPSLIKRGSDVTVVKLPSVPVGIINQVKVEPEFRLLRPGDLVVMFTDGIWDISKNETDKERWLLDHLSRHRSTDPEEIAESLLARAVDLMPDIADDMTVVVARVESIATRGAGDSTHPLPNIHWAPVRTAPRMKSRDGGQAVKKR